MGKTQATIAQFGAKTQMGFTKAFSGVEKAQAGLKKSFIGLGKIIGAVFAIRAIKSFADESTADYKDQMEVETKLATVMRQRMNASNEDIKSILNLATAQQKLGIISDETQIAGAQQLSTFLEQKKSLDLLVPAMNNLLAQQKGFNATQGDAVAIGNLFGKAMQGQTSALRRVGITFSEAEENALKYASEIERSALLANIITNNVGNMNFVLAQTDVGRQKQLANTFSDIKEQFGAAFTQISVLFLPALNAVAQALAFVANLARQVAQYIGMMFGKDISKDAQALSSTAGGYTSVGDAALEAGDDVSAGAKKAKGALAGFDEINNVQLPDASGSGGGANAPEGGSIGGGGGVGDFGGIGSPIEVDTSGFDAIIQKIKEIKAMILPLIIEMAKIGQSFIDGFSKKAIEIDLNPIKNLKNIVSNIGSGIQKGFNKIDFSAISSNLKTAVNGFGEIVANGLSNSLLVAESGSKAVGTAIQWGIAAGGKGVEIVTQALAQFTENNKENIMSWQNDISTSLQNAFGNLNIIFDTIGEAAFNSLDSNKNQIANILEGFMTTAAELGMTTGTIIAETIETITGNAAEFVTSRKDDIQTFFDTNVSMFTTFGDTINKIAQSFLAIIKKNWDEHFKGIIDSVSKAVLDIAGWFLDLYNKFIGPVVNNLLTWLGRIWDDSLKGIVDEVLGFIGRVGGLFVSLWDSNIKPFVDNFVKYFLPGITNAINTIMDVVGGIVNIVGGIIKEIIGVINGILDFITGVFSGNWEKAWNGIVKIFDSIFGGVKDVVKASINIVIDIINGMINGIIIGMNAVISAINSISFEVPDWIPGVGGSKVGFNLAALTAPQIPRLARGGIVDRATLAMIGESGKEAVMPLENNTGWMMDLANMIGMVLSTNGGASGNSGGPGAVYLDGKKVGSIIFDDLTAEARRRGVGMPIKAV